MEITYKIKFIDSFRFMTTSLSKLVENLAEIIHNDKCIKCNSNFCYMKPIDETLIFRCLNCNKNYKKEINKKLVERFSNTYEFCDKDLNKFILLLRKGVYPYEYIDGWDKFNEKSIPTKESFYSNLTLENIAEIDYIHANNVFKTFKLNNLGDYHDLYFFFFFLFNCCLVAPRPTSGHYRGDNLTHPMLITAFYIFDPRVTGSLVARLGP